MSIGDAPSDEALESREENRDARAFARLRDLFTAVVRPYVKASLEQEHEGFAYGDRMEVLNIRDSLIYGGGGGDDDEDEPDLDAQGKEIEKDKGGAENKENKEAPSSKVTEQELARHSSAVATALTYQWMSAIAETAMSEGEFSIEAGAVPDNFDSDPLFTYPIDPKEDLDLIMIEFTERLLEKENAVDLPMGLQIAKDGDSGYLVVSLAPGLG